MKKKLLFSIFAMAAVSAFGQGYISLDNYNSNSAYGGPLITYGFGVPANGVGGPLGTPSTGLLGGWTVGLYYAIGSLSLVDPSGWGMPNAALSLAPGIGSTASMYTSTLNTPGQFYSTVGFNTGAAAGSTITAEVVVYDTADGSYANALWRAHSDPFTMPTGIAINPIYPLVGDYMHGFSVGIPEPSTFALTGLGILSFLAFSRRKKA